MKVRNRKLFLLVSCILFSILFASVFAQETTDNANTSSVISTETAVEDVEEPVVYDFSKALVSEDGSISYFDKDELLRRFTSKDYGTLSVNISDSTTFLVDSYDSTSVRRKYDERMRLICKETWSIASSSADSSMLKKENYTYNQVSGLLTNVVAYDYSQKKMQQTDYNQDGLKIRQETFAYEDKKGNLEQNLLFKYDNQKRIIENEVTNYSGSKSTTQKELFSFAETGEQSEYSFYENNSLRIKRVFTSSQDYKEIAYFDGGFSVETIYQNGIKTESSLFFNGKFQNRTVYVEE